MLSEHLLPIIIVVALCGAVMLYSIPANVAPVNCTSDAAANAADVVMLSASWCQYCRRARNYFVERGVNYCEWDIEKTQRGGELYSRSNIQGIPIIYLGKELLVGFSASEIAQALVAQELLP
jgi:mycoredoxin